MASATRLSAEDRLDIMELYARYAWGLDLADEDEIVGCFTEDAWFDHLWQGRVQGHAAIIENLRTLWYGRPAYWYGRQHLFNHFRFSDAEADKVKVKCFNQIIQFSTEFNNYFVFGMGTREDVLVRDAGEWKFQSLFVNAWQSRDDIPWKGEMHLPPPRPPRAEKPLDKQG